MNGQVISRLELEHPGQYELVWGGLNSSGSQVPNGMYIAQAVGRNGKAQAKKMIFTGGSGSSGLVIESYGTASSEKEMPASKGADARMASETDTLKFDRLNTTLLYYQLVHEQTDIDAGQIAGNVGPRTTGAIPEQKVLLDQEMSLNLNDYVYNDEQSSYSARNPSFTIEGTLIKYVSSVPDTAETWVDIIDAVDAVLRDSIYVKVIAEKQANRAPVFTGTVPVQNVNEDNQLVLDAKPYFSDPDLDALNYILKNLANATYTVSNGIITITPNSNWNGTISDLVLEASDAEYTTASNTFNMEIAAVNDAPTFSGSIPTQNTKQDSTLTYILLGLDNGTYSENNGIITINPPAGWTGTDSGLIIRASDAEYNAESNQFSMEITPIPKSHVTFIFKSAAVSRHREQTELILTAQLMK